MGYEQALLKSWQDLEKVSDKKRYEVKFLSDIYEVNLESRTVFSSSRKQSAKDYVSILVAHYLKKSIAGLPQLLNKWVSFKELPGGEAYYPVFKKRVIDGINRKYGENPEAIFKLIERFGGKKENTGDASVAINVFDNVPMLATIWKGDDEFTSEANLLFDKSIANIFGTEDIVVLSEILAHNI